MRDCEGIFATDIDVPLLGTDSIGANKHSLDNAVGVTLQQGPIHVGARIAFIRVADDELLFSRRSPAGGPFLPGQKPPAPATSQTRFLDRVNDLLRGHFGKDLFQSLVATDGYVVIDL